MESEDTVPGRARRAVTLNDVAAAASVSVAVVSRVLRNTPGTRVRPETRERVIQAAQDLNYRPNVAGRALKLARSHVIALIVPDLTNVTELMDGVEDAARESGYMVLLGRAEKMQPGREGTDTLIGEGRVDGMLVQLSETVPEVQVQALLGYRSPVVFVNSVQNGHVGSVSLADEAGARVATEHVIELGHRRVGFVGGAPGSASARRRERGFRAAMGAAALEVDDRFVTNVGYSPRDGRAALAALVEQNADLPTALVVANVDAAIGALAQARALDVRVPEDVSVIAFNESWVAENSWPRLTTVKMPMYEVGRRGFGLLYERMNDGPARDVVIEDRPPQTIERDSTRHLAP